MTWPSRTSGTWPCIGASRRRSALASPMPSSSGASGGLSNIAGHSRTGTSKMLPSCSSQTCRKDAPPHSGDAMPTSLTQEESKALAHHIVEALILRLSDEQVVEALTTVWGKQLDQWIGKGIRRM